MRQQSSTTTAGTSAVPGQQGGGRAANLERKGNSSSSAQQQAAKPAGWRGNVRLRPPPRDAAAAKEMRADFTYALFAKHALYVMALPEAKAACLMRLSQADLARVLEQPEPEKVLDQLWEQHRSSSNQQGKN